MGVEEADTPALDLFCMRFHTAASSAVRARFFSSKSFALLLTESSNTCFVSRSAASCADADSGTKDSVADQDESNEGGTLESGLDFFELALGGVGSSSGRGCDSGISLGSLSCGMVVRAN